jgi:hypothetical protein
VATSKGTPAAEIFADATESSGIRFRHVNGMSGEFYYPEIIGPGVALFDFNNDGKLDLLVCRGRRSPPPALEPTCPMKPAPAASTATTWW